MVSNLNTYKIGHPERGPNLLGCGKGKGGFQKISPIILDPKTLFQNKIPLKIFGVLIRVKRALVVDSDANFLIKWAENALVFSKSIGKGKF